MLAKIKNNSFLKHGGVVTTQLEFHKDFGLGSSSTLIANIAQWANVNPYELLWEGFTGSGYDIACANSNGPLLYQLKNKKPIIEQATIDYPFKDQLFFVYLNKKQNSREGIALYRKRNSIPPELIQEISEISVSVAKASSLDTFEELLNKHESIIASLLNTSTVKTNLFADYKGCIKSLGAWGGDFILATGTTEYVTTYFTEKGFKTIIPFSKMIL